MLNILFVLFVFLSVPLLGCSHKRKRHFSPTEEHRSALRARIEGAGSASQTLSEAADELEFIYDRYTARRGEPKLLKIVCATCDDCIMYYQKDGPGRLLRCYLDRIRLPETLANLHRQPFSAHRSPQSPPLTCARCQTVVGTPMIYYPENRPAFRMFSPRFYHVNS